VNYRVEWLKNFADINKIHYTKASTEWNFTNEMFTLTQTGITTSKLLKPSTSKQL
jgi:hypothetical protein